MEQIKERTELIVSLYSTRQIKMLKKFGDIRYLSRKMHYVVMYVDADQVDSIIESLNNMNFVKSVKISPTPKLAQKFENFDDDNDVEDLDE